MWVVCVIIVLKRKQRLIRFKTNLKHEDTPTSSGSFVIWSLTTFYKKHCCSTALCLFLVIYQFDWFSHSKLSPWHSSSQECLWMHFLCVYQNLSCFCLTVIFTCKYNVHEKLRNFCWFKREWYSCSHHEVLVISWCISLLWKL